MDLSSRSQELSKSTLHCQVILASHGTEFNHGKITGCLRSCCSSVLLLRDNLGIQSRDSLRMLVTEPQISVGAHVVRADKRSQSPPLWGDLQGLAQLPSAQILVALQIIQVFLQEACARCPELRKLEKVMLQKTLHVLDDNSVLCDITENNLRWGLGRERQSVIVTQHELRLEEFTNPCAVRMEEFFGSWDAVARRLH